MNADSSERMSVAESVKTTLNNLDIEARDVGVATLALELAERIDREMSNRTAAELSAKLLAALHALNATPEARKTEKGGAQVVQGALARQRALRAGEP